jgi:hypothetical protein
MRGLNLLSLFLLPTAGKTGSRRAWQPRLFAAEAGALNGIFGKSELPDRASVLVEA